MAYTHAAPDSRSAPIPLGEWAPWAIFAGLVMLLALYFVSTEQGAVALFDGTNVHEFVHDARHLLGFPCH
ncbi:Probable cobalt transporter subunit (CbtB) [Paracoccus aminovorans]|uniref:Probable cobalt transporter subunit (CbtB) n=1 Tax=Paracoccus aminovorans TaxID=34004 RepID=A0A1I3CYI5_9RHOB|nr:CbtB-domain containing protein [Paracoccus aminovorans]CQR83803.1 putative cobalt ABC transporter [Paracoccus aminovorans]SFH79448.1 Probable cobalt transporter subunit (CbtB) [Paracoccus aminovorans]